MELDESTGSISADFGGGFGSSKGNNSIFNSGSNDFYIDLDGNQLKAENNCWGVSTGLDSGKITLESGSTIDADPFLINSPNH